MSGRPRGFATVKRDEPPEGLLDINTIEDEQLYEENQHDKEYMDQLECLGTYRDGLKFQLSNLIFVDVLRRKHVGGLLMTDDYLRWPSPPEELESAYLVRRKRKHPRVDTLPRSRTNTFPRPLYRVLNRPIESDATELGTECPDHVEYKNNPNLDEDLTLEMGEEPNPRVTIDNSFDLHMNLRDVVRKIWDQVYAQYGESQEALDNELGFSSPAIDRYLCRGVAESVQRSLSNLIDSIYDFRSDNTNHVRGDIRWMNIRAIAHLVGIPTQVIDRVDARMGRIFAGITEYDIRSRKSAKEDKDIPMDEKIRECYREFSRHHRK